MQKNFVLMFCFALPSPPHTFSHASCLLQIAGDTSLFPQEKFWRIQIVSQADSDFPSCFLHITTCSWPEIACFFLSPVVIQNQNWCCLAVLWEMNSALSTFWDSLFGPSLSFGWGAEEFLPFRNLDFRHSARSSATSPFMACGALRLVSRAGSQSWRVCWAWSKFCLWGLCWEISRWI